MINSSMNKKLLFKYAYNMCYTFNDDNTYKFYRAWTNCTHIIFDCQGNDESIGFIMLCV